MYLYSYYTSCSSSSNSVVIFVMMILPRSGKGTEAHHLPVNATVVGSIFTLGNILILTILIFYD